MARSRLITLLMSLFVTTTALYYLLGNADQLVHTIARAAERTGTHFNSTPRLVWFHGNTHDEPPKAPPYGAVVAAGRSTDDLQWMNFFVKE